MSYNVSELIKMKNKKKKQVSQENRILERDLLSRQSILTQNAISEEKLYEQRNTRQTCGSNKRRRRRRKQRGG